LCQIDTKIDIAAPPSSVWRVVVDFAAYPEWNPFIRHIEGEARAGARLSITVQPPGGRPMSFKPTVLVADPGRELRWLGRVLVPSLFDGEHRLGLVATDQGCRFVHGEMFCGLLVPLFGGMLDATAQGFAAMNAALKARAERS
jgi:hypothetical protein